eukprot:scaffold228819_cov37-Tisochrysis_lutea.AAC.2
MASRACSNAERSVSPVSVGLERSRLAAWDGITRELHSPLRSATAPACAGGQILATTVPARLECGTAP